jgi:hypothetical protein
MWYCIPFFQEKSRGKVMQVHPTRSGLLLPHRLQLENLLDDVSSILEGAIKEGTEPLPWPHQRTDVSNMK